MIPVRKDIMYKFVDHLMHEYYGVPLQTELANKVRHLPIQYWDQWVYFNGSTRPYMLWIPTHAVKTSLKELFPEELPKFLGEGKNIEH